MRRIDTYMAHECEYCGESQKNQQGRAAHERFCDENPTNKESSDENNTSKSENAKNVKIEIDSEFYAGKAGQLDVEDRNQPESECSECSNPVKPGTNCKACGAELDWYI